MSAARVAVEIEGRRLSLSNVDKVLYPQAGFTKGEVIDYYTRIAPAILPHLRGRPLTFKRYPDGVEQERPFFQKNSPEHRPDWVRTAAIDAPRAKRTINYTLADDLPTLVWAANLAALELHPSLSPAQDMSHPTAVVFDLDPGPPASIVECCAVALLIKELLEPLGLKSFAKTSGSKGLQLYVPLNADAGYEETKPFAKTIARLLERDHPKLVVSEMTKKLREGRVFVDWSQNDRAKTTVAVYSLRARERPTVSTPVSWDEVELCTAQGTVESLRFEAGEVLDRVERDGDLMAPLLELRQELPALGA